MYVQVVTYGLNGISEEQYLDTANQVAPRTASAPGLLAKIWLENAGANRYGAVYFWEDVESMERFARSDFFEGLVPAFSGLANEEFRVLENLTEMTQPVLELVERRRAGMNAPVKPGATSGSGVATSAPVASLPSQGRRKRTPPPRKPAASTGPAKNKKPPARRKTVEK